MRVSSPRLARAEECVCSWRENASINLRYE